MTTVKLTQLSLYQWELISPTNKVMVSGIAFGSQYEAECWVKNYISSHPTWAYEIVVLTRENV